MSVTRSYDVVPHRTRTVDVPVYIAGDSLAMAFTVRDTNNRPLSLTGGSARWGLAPLLNARTLGPTAYTLSSAPGIAISGSVVTVTLAASAFDTVGDFIHELEVTLASGVSFTPARGAFRCVSAVLAT